MAGPISQSELVRRAAEWINSEKNLNPKKSLSSLLDEAGARFLLSPLDAASLERIFREEQEDKKEN